MLFDDSGSHADLLLEQLIDAIENQDKDAVEGLFSSQALDLATDIDQQMSELFDFFQGTVESWDRTGSSSVKNIEGDTRETKNIAWYDVVTSNDSYVFFMISNDSTGTMNSDVTGLYSLWVINKEEEDSQLTDWEDMEIPGIHIP